MDYGGQTLAQLRQAGRYVDPRMRGENDVSGQGIYDVMPDWMSFGGSPLGGLAEDYNSQLNSVNGGSTAGAVSNFSNALVDGGLRPMEAPGANNSSWRWMEDAQGNVIVQPQQINNNDPAFAAAAAAAAAAVTAGVAGAGFGVGGAPAAGGAPTSGLLSGMDLAADAALGTGNNITTAGAALGSAAPAAVAAPAATPAAADPLAGYMTTGGAEGSLAGSGVTAAAGAAVPAGLSSIPSWLPAGLQSSWDFIKGNPKLIGALAGGLLGGVGATQEEAAPAPYTGPMPTITRGNFSASPTGYKPMAQQSYGGGLLSTPGTKQAASGMHRYMGLLGGG